MAQEQEQGQEQGQEQQQGSSQNAGQSSERSSTPNVLDFLRKSNIINMEMPLKNLFDQMQTLQTEENGWGLIGDSGHWVLVWKGE